MVRNARLIGSVFFISVSLVTAGCGSRPGSSSNSSSNVEKKVTIKLADDFPAGDPFNKYLQNFADEVQAKTHSSVTVKLFTGSQLGGESDIVRGIANNTLEMAMTGVTGYAPLDAFFTPYAVKSEHQLDLVLQQNILKQFFDKFQQTQNAKLLGSLYVSPREMTSSKPIQSLQDMQGLKIRVPQVAPEIKVFSALGADPTVLAFTEVYTALQGGTAQAQENPVSTILSAKFAEVQKYLDLTNHGIQPEWVFINSQTWSQLSSTQRDAVTAAFADIKKSQRAAGEAAFTKNVQELQKQGMIVTHPDYASFRAKVYTSTVQPLLANLWGADIAKKVSSLPSS
jgi:TRAP-type transport system periplasmic protein